MAQYVIEIRESDGWLAYSFEVTEEAPIPDDPAPGCVLVVMTNGDGFDAIQAIYDKYTADAVFDYDEAEEKIYCLAPPEAIGEWPKD